MTAVTAPSGSLHVEYCDEWFEVEPGRTFTIGRSGDLAVDDNRYLHRVFLELAHRDGFWTIANVGDRLAATVTDVDGSVSADLRPGAVLPLALPRFQVSFAAGPTSYQLLLVLGDAPFVPVTPVTHAPDGTMTRGHVEFTESQLLCILALAEPALRRGGSGASRLPASKDAARRLDWPVTTFNRKLDNVCEKLERAGVRGLRGEPGDLATNRRARLVEHAIATRLVTEDDLERLP